MSRLLTIQYDNDDGVFAYSKIYLNDIMDDEWADGLVEILDDIAKNYKTAKIWHQEQELKELEDDNA